MLISLCVYISLDFPKVFMKEKKNVNLCSLKLSGRFFFFFFFGNFILVIDTAKKHWYLGCCGIYISFEIFEYFQVLVLFKIMICLLLVFRSIENVM
jgi:hypothetical protein